MNCPRCGLKMIEDEAYCICPGCGTTCAIPELETTEQAFLGAVSESLNPARQLDQQVAWALGYELIRARRTQSSFRTEQYADSTVYCIKPPAALIGVGTSDKQMQLVGPEGHFSVYYFDTESEALASLPQFSEYLDEAELIFTVDPVFKAMYPRFKTAYTEPQLHNQHYVPPFNPLVFDLYPAKAICLVYLIYKGIKANVGG